MPAHGIVDSHVHLWDPDRFDYAWMAEEPALRRRFGPDDLTAACAGRVQLERVVFVQAETAHDRSLDEVDWVQTLAAADPRIAGIVARAPMDRGATGAAAALDALASRPLVRGIRHIIQWEAVDACSRPDFIDGVRSLAAHDLPFDVCVFHPQLPHVIELVRRCENVRFVLDHFGKPPIASGDLDPWRQHVTTLAELPNVACKLSGLTTEADPARWTEDDLRPYVDHVLQSFGPGRLLFGSDWPVATLGTTYPRWIEVCDRALVGLDDNERRAVWGGNAIEFYGLDG